MLAFLPCILYLVCARLVAGSDHGVSVGTQPSGCWRMTSVERRVLLSGAILDCDAMNCNERKLKTDLLAQKETCHVPPS
jgi:hypothetical protein